MPPADDADRRPDQCINFMVAHDGFTLHDMVAYNEKHNDANGEGNRDGSNDNFSWNWSACIAGLRRKDRCSLSALHLHAEVRCLGELPVVNAF